MLAGLKLPIPNNNSITIYTARHEKNKKKIITISERLSKPFSMHKHIITLNALKKRVVDDKRNRAYNIDSSLSAYNADENRRIDDLEKNDLSVIKKLPQDLIPQAMPKHVAMIMDGNNRWAEERGMPAQHGHYKVFETVKALISSCRRLGIQVFTIYAFSTENWSRSEEEVHFIMKAIEHLIRSDIMEMAKKGNNLRFSVIEDKLRLPTSLRSAITLTEESSKSNKGMHLVTAINYSGSYEIIEAVKKISEKIKEGTLRDEDINSEVFEQQLETAMVPEPDLLIRTSGELRISNFMLWQLAYSELYFCEKLFPDFEEEDLIEAIRSFQKRKRRFGGRKFARE